MTGSLLEILLQWVANSLSGCAIDLPVDPLWVHAPSDINCPNHVPDMDVAQFKADVNDHGRKLELPRKEAYIPWTDRSLVGFLGSLTHLWSTHSVVNVQQHTDLTGLVSSHFESR